MGAGMGYQNMPSSGVMFPGMGANDASAGGFNPYMMGMFTPSWFPGASSAAAFHVQGPKNEIKLFVGGL